MDSAGMNGEAAQEAVASEQDTIPDRQCRIARAAADVVAAFLANNTMDPSEVPAFCRKVAEALAGGEGLFLDQPARFDPLRPAVDPAKSVHHDYIICLEDGVRRKMLQRYLRVKFRMSPEQYRRRWNLPDDYPMVAPGHSERRAKIAVETGFTSAPAATSH